MSEPYHKEIYPALLRVAGDRLQPESLRGQAFEGIAYHRLSRRHHLWSQSLDVLKAGLTDASEHVVFWSCFAAGHLSAQELLPILTRLRDTDTRVEPDWWPIADEASDAISTMEA